MDHILQTWKKMMAGNQGPWKIVRLLMRSKTGDDELPTQNFKTNTE